MSAFRKKRIIVAQGEVCDSIFLNPTVRVRLTVVSREEGTHQLLF